MAVSTIVKRTEAKNYSMVHNCFWTDMNLTGDALRVLGYLLSKPEGWKIREMDIRRQFAPIGKEMATNHFYRAVTKNLQAAGYMKKYPLRNESGQVTEWVTEISDRPIFCEGQPDDDSQMLISPHVVKPDVGSTTCGEINTLNNKETISKTEEDSNTEGDSARVRATDDPPTDLAGLDDLFRPELPATNRARGQKIDLLTYKAPGGYQSLFDACLGLFPQTGNFTEKFEELIRVSPDMTYFRLVGWLDDQRARRSNDTYYLGNAVNYFQQNPNAYKTAAAMQAADVMSAEDVAEIERQQLAELARHGG